MERFQERATRGILAQLEQFLPGGLLLQHLVERTHVGTHGVSGTLVQLTMALGQHVRSEEHTSELQSLMRNSYAVFCLKKKIQKTTTNTNTSHTKHIDQY